LAYPVAAIAPQPLSIILDFRGERVAYQGTVQTTGASVAKLDCPQSALRINCDYCWIISHQLNQGTGIGDRRGPRASKQPQGVPGIVKSGLVLRKQGARVQASSGGRRAWRAPTICGHHKDTLESDAPHSLRTTTTSSSNSTASTSRDDRDKRVIARQGRSGKE